VSAKIVVDPTWMRRAAREIDRAADDAAAGNADMKWLLDTDISGVERAKLATAYRSTRSVPEALRAVSRSLSTRAALIDLSEQMVWGASGVSRISMPKWLKKKILKIAKGTIKITGIMTKFVDQAQDYAHLADKARNGTFWGNFCGAGNKGETKTPTDTLDACCKVHDAAYKRLGITASSQFSPAGLMKTAAANAALSKCARKQPDGTESGNMRRFDPDHVNSLDIEGEDARSGVMKLFGLMSEIGYALTTAEAKIKKRIDAIPGISGARAKELAEWALRTAAKEILDSYADRFGELGPLA